MFHVTRNTPFSETKLLSLAETELRERLPAAWDIRPINVSPTDAAGPDRYLEITAPDQTRVPVAVKVLAPATASRRGQALDIIERMRQSVPTAKPMAVASYLSPLVRASLSAQNIGFVDATGNVRLSVDRPGLFIETIGAERDPMPDNRPLRSLRGAAAGRAVRAFVDFMPPYGIRELGQRASVPAPTLSRVGDVLEHEGILERDGPRGRVTAVDWQAALRRWALDYSFTRSNRTSSWLEPRGLLALLDKVRALPDHIVLTGSLAAGYLAPITVPRLAALYTKDSDVTAHRLGLRPAETAGNVLLVEPFDTVVFARMVERDQLALASPSQLAVDLLTGPGRWPAEGEALIEWMQAHEQDWRA